MEWGTWALVALGVIAILAVAVVTILVRCYRRLTFSFDSVRALPEFEFSTGAVLRALVGVVTRNYTQAAGGLLKGLKVEGIIVCTNQSFTPLYLPATEHKISVEGSLCPCEVRLPAFWLKPHAARSFPVSVALNNECLPQVAIAVLSGKGVVRVEVRTRAKIGLFSYNRVTHLEPSLWRGTSVPRESATKKSI